MSSEVPVYSDVCAAYLDQLRATRSYPEYRNAPRGQQSRERLGVGFTIDKPRERAVPIAARRPNLVFCFAEALWYLSGRDDVEFIANYAPSIRRYSLDGIRLRGTAYGPRVFAYHGIDQWRSVQAVLREDPDSKRAFIQIFDPAELLDDTNIDVACTVGLQFFVRDGLLRCSAYMRANDAFRGAVSDLFSFTFMQEFMAASLGLEVGQYTHFVGTYHLYDRDEAWADAVLQDPVSVARDAFPAMPLGDNWPSLAAVMEVEAASRRFPLSDSDIAMFSLSQYWLDVARILALHNSIERGDSPHPTLYEALPRLYQQCLALKWPQLNQWATAAEVVD